MSKGQIFSIDFMASLMFFLPFLLIMIFLWNYSETQYTETERTIDMRDKAVLISDLLLKSEGYPKDWNSANVVTLGLAKENNKISNEKLNRLYEINCTRFKEIFDMKYNFFLEITDVNDNILFTDDKCGNYSNAEDIIPIQRYGLLEEKLIKMEVLIWE